MKKNSKNSLILIIVLIVLLFNGCADINSYQKSIYDDASKISAMGDSYSFVSRIGNFNNNNFSISFKGFSGKQTLWKLTAKEDCTSILDLKTEIESGKFKICLININKEVIPIEEGTKDEAITIDIQKGDNYITIVGNEASGKVDLAVAENEKVTVTQIND